MMSVATLRLALSIAAVVAVGACSGDAAQEQSPGPSSGGGDAAATPAATAEDPDVVADAALGKDLYHAKGCPACHTIGGGRLVGPDLVGVTDRRERDWILGMILRPDSMLKVDETARELLAEYFTPMAPLPMSDTEAASLYLFLVDSAGAN